MNLTHRFDQWLYREGRPNRLARMINRVWARLAAAGLAPGSLVMLEVAGRRTGRTISFPAVVADYEGERYLVSMLGEGTSWVRNVRSAGGHAVLRHGRREAIRLEEVDPRERAPILRRYIDCAPGARSHIPVKRGAPLKEYEAIAPRFPVFRITAREQAGVRRP
jgi:hypothetical protein